MSHFDSDFDAVVDGTYSQKFGGSDIDSYSVYVLSEGKVVNRLSWYHENQLTVLAKQDNRLADELIEEYNLRN